MAKDEVLFSGTGDRGWGMLGIRDAEWGLMRRASASGLDCSDDGVFSGVERRRAENRVGPTRHVVCSADLTCNLIMHMQNVVRVNVCRNGSGSFLGWDGMGWDGMRWCVIGIDAFAQLLPIRARRTVDGAGAIVIFGVLGDPLHVDSPPPPRPPHPLRSTSALSSLPA
jgi:hypothetical protein